ncbi:MAG: citrate synthase [Planctomycetes bacterium]|nr:citrate synthase [Planctomycetota bacterium]
MTKQVFPGLEGVAIAESSISFVDGQKSRLEYRGIGIDELGEHSHFEEVCLLLLNGSLPGQKELDEFRAKLVDARALKGGVIDLIKCLPKEGHPMDALQAAVAAVGMFYPGRHGMTPAEQRDSCVRLIAKIPTILAAFQRMRQGDDPIPPGDDLSHAANFMYMLTGEVPDEFTERTLDVALVLHADHTMNASTFAGRVVGSTLADPYCVVSSALGALSGPLHGGANEEVLKLLQAIGTIENVRPTIERMIANKEKIMGFGHRVYKTMDPRAVILKQRAAQLAQRSGNPLFPLAVEVEKVVIEHYGAKGIWPNVDFYSGLVYSEMGIPPDCFTPVFAIARVAGWLAHWLEQLDGNRIYRPTQVYTGPHEQPYVPIEQRR